MIGSPANPYVDVPSPVNGGRLPVQLDRFGVMGPAPARLRLLRASRARLTARWLSASTSAALIDELPYVPAEHRDKVDELAQPISERASVSPVRQK